MLEIRVENFSRPGPVSRKFEFEESPMAERPLFNHKETLLTHQ